MTLYLLAVFAAPAPAEGAGALLGLLCLLGVGILAYFIPTEIAVLRGHPNGLAIFVLNLLLGGTGVGWIVALVWSLTAIRRTDEF